MDAGWRTLSLPRDKVLVPATLANDNQHLLSFRQQAGLADEVVENYFATARMCHLCVWEHPGTSLADKLQGVVDYNYGRLRSSMPMKKATCPGARSAGSCLKANSSACTARTSPASFTDAVYGGIRSAIDCAWRQGELCDDAPCEDRAFLITNIVNNVSVFTHGAGGFRRLRLFFEAFPPVTRAAYSPSGPKQGSGNRVPRGRSRQGEP